GSLYWIEGYPGFPAGISEAELAERAAVQAGTLAAHEVQLAGGTVTGGVVTLADGSAIAPPPPAVRPPPAGRGGPRGLPGFPAPIGVSSGGRPSTTPGG